MENLRDVHAKENAQKEWKQKHVPHKMQRTVFGCLCWALLAMDKTQLAVSRSGGQGSNAKITQQHSHVTAKYSECSAFG